jgi:hypothetical protein
LDGIRRISPLHDYALEEIAPQTPIDRFEASVEIRHRISFIPD